MTGRLAGKTALISGASSGLGRSAALAMAREGAAVIVGARREDKLADVVREIEAGGGTANAIMLDVTDREGVADAFRQIEDMTETLDILVNSAGVGRAVPFLETNKEDFEWHFDVNVKGLWRVSRDFSRLAIGRGHGGSIINIASMLALGVHPGQSLYCATKGAVLQMTRAMALELQAKGIRANCVCPGYFKTEMTEEFAASAQGQAYVKRTPAKRFAEPNELDGAIIYLASDDASFTTGTHISVDGGQGVRIV
ncbi:SDR family oxidoreductase [Pacificimonas sp. WHA3]|uniref:SDR family oxidoreductase n=1 Tax=Pacificimonas pallii TaxID=2827236 RepID=A0ABS6SC81_9SPHN|nr:SDR family oxidoreductase [Pacificimonas pallii]MBV7255970.1 SDR family oxidoreductase [Pacificimonas pallii]